jgi:hypothetical protein
MIIYFLKKLRQQIDKDANQHEQEWSHDSNHKQLELAQTLGH